LGLDPDRELGLDLSRVSELCRYLQVIAQETRLQILHVLSRIEKAPVCLIAAILNRDDTLISHHLRTLRIAGLVVEQVCGRFRVYSLNRSKLEQIIRDLRMLVGI